MHVDVAMSSHPPLLPPANLSSSIVTSNSSGHDDALALGDADCADGLADSDTLLDPLDVALHDGDTLPLSDTVALPVTDTDALIDAVALTLLDADDDPDHDTLDVPLIDTLPLSLTLPLPLSLTLPLRDVDGDDVALLLPLTLLLSLTLPLSLTLALTDGDHDTLPVADGVLDTHAPMPVCTCTHSTPIADVSTDPLSELTNPTLTLDPTCATSISTTCTVSDPYPATWLRGLSGNPHAPLDGSVVYDPLVLSTTPTVTPSTSTDTLSPATQWSIVTMLACTRTMVWAGRSVTTLVTL